MYGCEYDWIRVGCDDVLYLNVFYILLMIHWDANRLSKTFIRMCVWVCRVPACLYHLKNISAFLGVEINFCTNHRASCRLFALMLTPGKWSLDLLSASGRCCSSQPLVRDTLTLTQYIYPSTVNLTVNKASLPVALVLHVELCRSDRISKLWQESSVRPKSLPETAVPPNKLSRPTPSGPNMKSSSCLYLSSCLAFMMYECICVLMCVVWCL